jgi:serine/threonine protein kinase/formylglycine-generating enzyme required for sulfatase activity
MKNFPVQGGEPVQTTDETIFAVAMEKNSPTERAAYLDEACAGNETLRKQVEELLSAYEAAGDFLQAPAADEFTLTHLESGDVPEALSLAGILEGPGTRVGAYRLLERIGEGGFGVVYRAEQKEPVRRHVALKIIKPGMDTAEIVGRFESERQALAIMDHPHIARVLDGGATASGRPYFVMELVKGVPITDYCDEFNFTPRERLELLIPVCEAIQHAHQKGIIHRDIKPSNVLITLQDGRPTPKVIDFGVAKATRQPLTQRSLHTQAGQIIGTLQYMSPEQAGLSELDVDTRSDVYSLGVLLYELLTGTTPIDRDRLRSATYDEVQRIIRDEEPPKPSTRISKTVETSLSSIAAHRRTDPKALGKLIRGDLDWIVMKALEKDRTRRYASALELASDLRRHLRDEPVEARPPTTTYRIQKFARRHRSLLGAAIGVFLVLILATSVSTWLAIRASLAESAALEAKHKLEEANRHRLQSLVQSLFNAAPGSILNVIEQMDLSRQEVIPELRRRNSLESRPTQQRARIAYALAVLGERDPQLNSRLLHGIAAASPAELPVIQAAVRRLPPGILSELRERGRAEHDPRVRLRLAAVALHLGDSAPAREMLAFQGDPRYRTAFIHGLSDWHRDASDWVKWLQDSDDDAYRSGICLSLGQLSKERVGLVEQPLLQQLVTDLFQTAPDAATHSAARYVLTRWKLSPSDEPRGVTAGVDWFVNRQGMTMLRVNTRPPGRFRRTIKKGNHTEMREVTLTRPYFICDREVWESLFARFLRDTGYGADALPDHWQEALARGPDAELSDPNAERPVWWVNCDDAIHFCNWLSEAEGRSVCYRQAGDDWQCDFDADGYRLPTEAEWEYACRAGTHTTWHFGNEQPLLESYAQTANNALRAQRQPGRSLLPNDFGLFDTYGNVCEWCWDRFAAYPLEDLTDPLGPGEGRSRVFRGGGTFNHGSDECLSSVRRSTDHSSRFTNLGFRVVCGDTAEIVPCGTAPP